MAQTVANLNGTVADLTNRNKEMAKTISTLVEKIVKFENIIKTLNEKTKNLEDQLAYEKKLRCGDSDSSNSPPLVKKNGMSPINLRSAMIGFHFTDFGLMILSIVTFLECEFLSLCVYSCVIQFMLFLFERSSINEKTRSK